MKLTIIILLAFLICPVGAEEGELSRRAERIIGAYEKGLADALEDYEEAKAEARDNAIKGLNEEPTRVTKRGDLETAIAIKAKYDEIKAEDEAAEEALMLGRPVANQQRGLPQLRRLLVNETWMEGYYVYNFDQNGVFDHSGGWIEEGWTLEGKVLTLRWRGEDPRILTYNQDNKAFEGSYTLRMR